MDIHYETIGTLATAVGALITSVIALRVASRSADATEAQATATKDAARAADASVRAADAMLTIERDRRHEEMNPDLQVAFRWRFNERSREFNLFAFVTNASKRDYQMAAVLVLNQNTTSSGGGGALGGEQMVEVYLGTEGLNLPIGLRLEFDSVDPCPCPRTTPTGRHWQRLFRVIPPEVPQRPA